MTDKRMIYRTFDKLTGEIGQPHMSRKAAENESRLYGGGLVVVSKLEESQRGCEVILNSRK